MAPFTRMVKRDSRTAVAPRRSVSVPRCSMRPPPPSFSAWNEYAPSVTRKRVPEALTPRPRSAWAAPELSCRRVVYSFGYTVWACATPGGARLARPAPATRAARLVRVCMVIEVLSSLALGAVRG